MPSKHYYESFSPILLEFLELDVFVHSGCKKKKKQNKTTKQTKKVLHH